MNSVFFVFKQKTAYAMRIRDWSSDVCSSDLQFQVIGHRLARMFIELEGLRGGVFEALANAAADAGERALAASALKVLVADKARFVVNQEVGRASCRERGGL